MSAAGREQKARHIWTAVDEECLRRWYANEPTELITAALGISAHQVHRKARLLGLAKSHEAKAAAAAKVMANPEHPGRRTRFEKGMQPWNAGLKIELSPACRATQFKPGTKPVTTMPIGAHRVVDGYLQRKTTELPGAPHLRWRCVHELVWVEAKGPVPPGHLVVFKPGMHTADLALITLDRVELISRAELMRRNTIHNMHPELADIARLRGVLKKAINRKTQPGDTP